MSDINIKMKMDGEAEFKRAVKDANGELKNMEAELKKVDATTEGQANTLKSLEARYDALTKVQEAAKAKTKALSDAVEAATMHRDKAKETLDELRESESANAADVAKAEKAYKDAESSLTDWQTKLTKAETDEIRFNNAVEETSAYMEEAKASGNDAATSIDGYGKKVSTASENTDQLLNVMSKTAAMEAIKGLAEQVGGAFTKLGDAAYAAMIKMDEGFDIIITKTGATGDALESMKQSAETVFGSMPTDMNTVGTAIGEVNTKFGLTGKALEDVTTSFIQFADINSSDVNDSIDMVARIMKQYGENISDVDGLLGQLTARGHQTGKSTTDLMRDLDRNAGVLKTYGLSLEESVNFLGQMELNGIDAGTAITGLRRAAKNYAKDGEDMRQGIERTLEAIRNATTDTEAYAIAQETFGAKGFTAVTEAIREGRFTLDGLTDSFEEYTSTVESTYNETKNAWDTWTTAQNNLTIAGGELSAEFYEALTPAIEGVTGFVQDATNKFRELPEPMQEVLGVAGGLVVEAGKLAPKIFEVGTSIATLQAAKQAASSLATMSGQGAAAATSAGKLSGALAALGNPVVLAAIGAVVAGLVIAKNAVDDLRQDVDEMATEIAVAAGESASEIDLYRASLENAGTAENKFTEASKALKKAQDASAQATEDLNKIQDTQNNLLEDTRQEIQETNSGWVKAAKVIGALGGANIEGALTIGEMADSTKKLNEAREEANSVLDTTTEAEREFIHSMGEAVSEMEADNEMTRGMTNGTIELAEAYGYANGTAGEAIEALGQLSLAHQETRQQIQIEIDGINTAMQELQAEYDAAYEAAYNSLEGQFGLFEQVKVEGTASVEEMTAALDSQMQFMVDYATNLQKAAEMGVSEGLIKQLSDGSVESAKYLQAIVDGGEEKVGDLNRAWEKTENGKQAFAKVLAEQQTDFNNRMSALESRLNTAVNNMNKSDQAYNTAAQTIQGYILGAESKRGAIIAEFTSLANAGNAAYKAALNQSSPSKVFYQNAVDTFEGNILGAEAMKPKVEEVYESIGLSAAESFNPAAYMSDINRYTGSTMVNNQVAVYIGDKELTGIMAQGVIKNISAQQRSGYAGIRR